VSFRRWGNDWHSVLDESEAFYLRILAPGDLRYHGGDLGALVTRGRLETEDYVLSERCKLWIAGVKAGFAGHSLEPQEPTPAAGPLAFKMA
jgi:hypothetical protein